MLWCGDPGNLERSIQDVPTVLSAVGAHRLALTLLHQLLNESQVTLRRGEGFGHVDVVSHGGSSKGLRAECCERVASLGCRNKSFSPEIRMQRVCHKLSQSDLFFFRE